MTHSMLSSMLAPPSAVRAHLILSDIREPILSTDMASSAFCNPTDMYVVLAR